MSWTKDDSAEHDNVPAKEVSRAWHSARDDAASSGELDERNSNKTSDSENGGFLNFLARLAGLGSDDK